MNTPIHHPQSAHDIRTRQAPIWAPNPAVPIIARILAYCFGALMMVTVVRSCLNVRPPSFPTYPAQWKTFSAEPGMTIPYPGDWTMHDQSANDNLDLIFMMLPNDLTHIEVLVIREDETVDAERLQQITARINERMMTIYPGYRAQEGEGDNAWRRFRANGVDKTPMPIAGAWNVRAQGNRILYLVAVSHEDGWSTMERIATHVMNEARF